MLTDGRIEQFWMPGCCAVTNIYFYIYNFFFQDLIIEAIYAGIIKGKLDQKNKQLEVDYAIGRDIRSEAIPEIISVLQEW